MYGASNEFLVWHEILPHAIVHTFTVSELVFLIDRTPIVESIIQPSVLTDKGDYKTSVIQILKQSTNALDAASVSALAVLVRFFGLTHTSSLAQISHILGDLIRGLGIKVTSKDAKAWQSLARAFDHELGLAPSAEARAMTKLAFLEGICSSFTDWIYGNRVQEEQAMLRRGVKVGLAKPADVVTGELEIERLALEKHIQRNNSDL